MRLREKSSMVFPAVKADYDDSKTLYAARRDVAFVCTVPCRALRITPFMPENMRHDVFKLRFFELHVGECPIDLHSVLTRRF